ILEKEKENKQTELQEIIQKEKKLQNKIAEIEKSTRYKEYLGLGRKIQASKEKIKETKKELLQKFALIERPLKKYKRTSLDEKLIDEYLQNPSAALKEDKNLKILAILEKLKEKLESLGIKDKKIGKTKEEITTINKEFLERKNKELAELEEQQKNYEQQIKANISNLNLMEEKTHLESIIEQRKLKEREIEDIENKMERSNPKFIKQKIKDSLKKIDVILKT
ncbi:MAG: hypothetical protein KKH40_06590, partial [Nanoarchaeota archaeon]|nr:hypothetical protein [Nanoarchaeota archaeon]